MRSRSTYWIGLPSCLLLGAVQAQCTIAIDTGPGIAGLDNGGVMTRWDPDGSGPTPELVVFAGAFEVAGALLVNHVATYDPVTGEFGSLGTGLDGVPNAITVTANGELVVVGNFQTAGGVAARGVARWNGTSWSALGAGFAPYPANDLRAVAELPNGDIVVGGVFWWPGGFYSGLARWDGVAWSPIAGIAPQPSYATVFALLTLANGELLVGGSFAMAGGMTVNSLARWDGANWLDTGGGVTFSSGSAGSVWTLARLADGSIAVGGQFYLAGGFLANHVARWTGSAWYGLNAGMQPANFARVASASVAPNGDLVVAGSFQSAGGTFVNHVARWDGASWHAYGNGVPHPAGTVLALAADDLLLSGGFASTVPHRWNGSSWRVLRPGFLTDPGFQNVPRVLLQRADGSFVVSVGYTDGAAEAQSALFVRDGSSWTPLGTGLQGAVYTAVDLPNGDLVVGGNFALASPTDRFLARWDGATWSLLGNASPNGYVTGLLRLANGDIVAAGVFSNVDGVAAARIARWNGASWSPLGAGLDSSAAGLALLPDGDVVVVGHFSQAGGAPANRIASWDGTQWSPFGSGLNGAAGHLAVLPNGDLVVSGLFTQAGGAPASHVARWDGSAWSPLGAGITGQVDALAVLPNGDVAAGGAFEHAGGVAASRLARWNGTRWSALTGDELDGRAVSLFATPDGELWVGGTFLRFGAQAAGLLLGLSTTCPSQVAARAGGCLGTSGGTLSTATGAWTGGTFRSSAIDLPSAAVVFVAYGFAATALPLTAVFPTAVPGCTLLASPDVVDLTLVAAGSAASQFDVPGAPSLAGTVFHHQMVAVNLDGSLAMTATNALTVTVGTF